MTTYQTRAAPTLLRGDLQGKRQLGREESTSVLLKQTQAGADRATAEHLAIVKTAETSQLVLILYY